MHIYFNADYLGAAQLGEKSNKILSVWADCVFWPMQMEIGGAHSLALIKQWPGPNQFAKWWTLWPNTKGMHIYGKLNKPFGTWPYIKARILPAALSLIYRNRLL